MSRKEPVTRRPLSEIAERTFVALRATGLSVQEAFDTCRALLYGELRGGKAHHGLDRMEWICRHCGRDFHPGRRASIRWRSESAGILEIDGHDGVGYSQIYFCLLLAQRLLTTRDGVSILLRRSYPTNCLGDYAAILAGMGLCSHVGTVSPNKVTFPGGSKARLPTSAQAFGFPGGAPSVVLDFSIGAANNGDLVNAIATGRPLAEGCFVNRHGHPTTRPEEVVDAKGDLVGAILPRGGHDAAHVMAGLGVNLLLTAASVGLNPQEKGSFVIARKPVPEFPDLLTGWSNAILDGEPAAFLPGHRSFAQARKAITDGELAVADKAWRAIVDNAERAAADPFQGLSADRLVAEMTGQLRDDRYAPVDPAVLAQLDTEAG